MEFKHQTGAVSMVMIALSPIAALFATMLYLQPATAQDAALVARGDYLVNGAAACGNCHTQPTGMGAMVSLHRNNAEPPMSLMGQTRKNSK